MLPTHLCILDVCHTLQIVHIARLANIHHCLKRQAIAHIVLITEIASIQLEASVVVLRTKACVEVTEYVDDSLSLRLYGCGILCLCVDTNAG